MLDRTRARLYYASVPATCGRPTNQLRGDMPRISTTGDGGAFGLSLGQTMVAQLRSAARQRPTLVPAMTAPEADPPQAGRQTETRHDQARIEAAARAENTIRCKTDGCRLPLFAKIGHDYTPLHAFPFRRSRRTPDALLCTCPACRQPIEVRLH